MHVQCMHIMYVHTYVGSITQKDIAIFFLTNWIHHLMHFKRQPTNVELDEPVDPQREPTGNFLNDPDIAQKGQDGYLSTIIAITASTTTTIIIIFSSSP